MIAIIIMLSAMLLPALVGARERANDAKCISNMRQIGVAMKMYQDDNETRFPLASLPVTGEGGQVVYREFRFAIGGKSPKEGDGHSALIYGRQADRPLNPYAPNAEVFRCPEDRGVALQACSCPNMPDTKWEEIGCSYCYNAGNFTPLSDPPTLLPQQDPVDGLAGKLGTWIPDPRRYIVMHEPPARPWGCTGRPAIWVQWHHAQGRTEFTDPRRAPAEFLSTVLFGDGHVQIHNFTKGLTDDVLHPYEETRDWI